MAPFLMPLAWLGGRSFDEMRDKSAADCDSSINVGTFGLVSAGMIGGGQYLFWSHLQHTADGAFWITVAVTLLYVLFYRNLIRAQEVAGRLGKGIAYLVAGGIVCTNALLAGHEWVLLAFKPQVESQAALSAAKGITEYGSAVENSLGLPMLRNDSKSVDDALLVARAERVRVPDAVTALRNQAQRCDRVAASLQASIPIDSGSPGYAAARSTWREQQARCGAARAQADRILRDHLKQVDDRIADLDDRRSTLDKKLSDASAEHEATLKRDAPSINAGATSGFARHKALWAAVESGRVPLWAAVGLMFIALSLEGMSFFVKIILPADAATQERRMSAEMGSALLDMRLATIRAYRANVPSVVASIQGGLADDVKRDIDDIIVPGLRTEIASRSFDHTHAAVVDAQRRHGKIANDLLSRLHDLGAAVRDTMGLGLVGSR